MHKLDVKSFLPIKVSLLGQSLEMEVDKMADISIIQYLLSAFLIVVDTHSKWPEVITMSSNTSQCTISELRSLFFRYGLPEQIVSDKGIQLTSKELSS